MSLILFLGMLIEFLLVKQAATATFFLLLVVELHRRARRFRGNFALGPDETLRLKVSSAFLPDQTNIPVLS